MDQKKIIIFLIIITLGSSSAISFYLLKDQGLIPWSSKNYTGTMLDKFDNPTDTPSENIINKNPSIKQLSDVPVTAPVATDTNQIVRYYQKSNGKVIDIDIKTGSSSVVSNSILPGFIDTIWSPTHQEVISLFQTKKGAQYKYYDYRSHRTVILPEGIQALSFSPNGDQIAYLQLKDNEGIINISQPDGKIGKSILKTRLENIKLYWPSVDKIYFATEDNNHLGQLFSLDLDGNIANILTDIPHLEIAWSTNGDSFIYSSLENGVLNTYIHNIKTSTETKLRLGTYASKCAWEHDTIRIVCGIPSIDHQDDGSIKNLVPDSLYEISSNTGDIKPINTPTQPQVSIKQVLLTTLDNYVVFINQYDQKLYGLEI